MLQYVSLGLLGIFCLIVIVNLVRGLIKGLKKSLACLAGIILSVVIALILTLTVCTPELATDFIETAKTVVTEPEILELLEVEELGATISNYSVMLASPFFFMLAFIPISLIVCLVCAIVIRFIPILKSFKGLKNRLFGMLVGLACGLIVSVACLMPIIGTADLISTVDTVVTSDTAGEELDAIVHDVAEDKVIDALGIGCKPLYNMLASTRFEGEKIYLKDEFASIVTIIDSVDVFAGEFASYGEDEIAALQTIVDSADRSPLLKNTVAGLLSTAAGKWTAGETFMGVEKPQMDGAFSPVLDTMLKVVATSDKDTIGGDLQTLVDVLGILIRSDMLSYGDNVDAMLEAIGSGNVVSDIMVAINKNEHMAPLSDDIVGLCVSIMTSSIGIPEESTDPSVVTADEVCAQLGKFSDCQDPEAEAEKVAGIVTGALSTFADIDFENATPSTLLPKLGALLDKMSESEIFGRGFSSRMLKALIQSDAVTSSIGIPLDEATALADKINALVEDGNSTYEHATEVIAGTLDMLSASSSKDMSKEEKIEASQKLLDSITPESAEMLGSMMTPAMLESIGVSSENSEAISSTVSSLLENMANYETGESSGDASREAEAVNTILDIALNGASADGALFNGDGGDGALGASAEELVDLVMSSEVISGTLEEVVNQNGYSDNPMGIPELSEADSAQLSAAIEAYYAAGGNDPEMASQLEALAAILNLNIELD
jgi:uncharacterized membrane protein required for colicin V production